VGRVSDTMRGARLRGNPLLRVRFESLPRAAEKACSCCPSARPRPAPRLRAAVAQAKPGRIGQVQHHEVRVGCCTWRVVLHVRTREGSPGSGRGPRIRIRRGCRLGRVPIGPGDRMHVRSRLRLRRRVPECLLMVSRSGDRGARAHGLPPEYVESLLVVEAVEDPRPERDAENRAALPCGGSGRNPD
jgi:hypothetical protein